MTATRNAAHPVNDCFVNRWSPRAFDGSAMPAADLKTLFEALRWAPSSNNLQPWKVLYAHKGTPHFETFLGGLSERNRSWAKNASVLIYLLSNRMQPGAEKPVPSKAHAFDAGAAWAHLALQASMMGYATHAIGGFDETTARSALKVPDDYHINVAIALGRQADKSILPEDLQAREQPSQRKSIEEFTREGLFS